jgi:hypothetical protein
MSRLALWGMHILVRHNNQPPCVCVYLLVLVVAADSTSSTSSTAGGHLKLRYDLGDLLAGSRASGFLSSSEDPIFVAAAAVAVVPPVEAAKENKPPEDEQQQRERPASLLLDCTLLVTRSTQLSALRDNRCTRKQLIESEIHTFSSFTHLRKFSRRFQICVCVCFRSTFYFSC